MEQQKGHCKHGEFSLMEGCYLCIEERRAWEAGQSIGDAPPSVGSAATTPITKLPMIEFDEPVVISRASPVGTALVNIEPDKDLKIIAFYNEALRALEYAEARVIKTVEDLKPASDDLLLIRGLKKAMEEKRKEYVKPLQDHTKAINDTFKMMMTPIERADDITCEKIMAFGTEQARIRREQEEINRKRMEAAKQEMRLKGELTESVNLVEVIPELSKRISTEMGTVGQRDHWTFQITDFSLLPDEYKMPDSAKIGKVVRAGLHTITGVKIWNDPILAGSNR